jgi:membrane-bound lytic murein transglycosylase C
VPAPDTRLAERLMRRSPSWQRRAQRGLLQGCLLLTTLGLGSCAISPEQIVDVALSEDPEAAVRSVIESELQRKGLPTRVENLPDLVRAVRGVLQDIWGEREPEIASQKRYVKYSNAYQARAIVDFEAGWLQVETIARDQAQEKLRNAIIATLLSTRDMRLEDIFTDAEPDTDGEPFLLGQVLDQDGEPIRWRWRAERFADHLIATALTRGVNSGKPLLRVRTDLVDDHLHLRELEYSADVLAAAQRYNVDPALIYAVIEVESAFNPYAVSPARAYGLMQVVPATAGRDVYTRVKKRSGEPSRDELFRPDFNIDIGSAYLYLLDDIYLNQIKNSNSRHFAMIAAYNGGPGSTLRAFGEDRSLALRRINSLQPTQVYDQLRLRHPFAETRRYLEKVSAAEGRYR